MAETPSKDRTEEQTVDLKSARPAKRGAPLLPHERDQNAAVVDEAAVPDPVIRQAAKDLAAGQQDTDRRADAARHFERANSEGVRS
ncbi:MAG: hypothetical protein AB7L76_09440, partial [Burkholderiaceae bacterium]